MQNLQDSLEPVHRPADEYKTFVRTREEDSSHAKIVSKLPYQNSSMLVNFRLVSNSCVGQSHLSTIAWRT
jgi:hypothetical protein